MCALCDALHALGVFISEEILYLALPRYVGWRWMLKSAFVKPCIAFYGEVIELDMRHVLDDVLDGSGRFGPGSPRLVKRVAHAEFIWILAVLGTTERN